MTDEELKARAEQYAEGAAIGLERHGYVKRNCRDDVTSALFEVIETVMRVEAEALRAENERLRGALVMYDDKANDVQEFTGDPSSYVYNALETAKLVHGDTVSNARAALQSKGEKE
jgi:hypothetical protein